MADFLEELQQLRKNHDPSVRRLASLVKELTHRVDELEAILDETRKTAGAAYQIADRAEAHFRPLG